jgi:hypothetical protein
MNENKDFVDALHAGARDGIEAVRSSAEYARDELRGPDGSPARPSAVGAELAADVGRQPAVWGAHARNMRAARRAGIQGELEPVYVEGFAVAAAEEAVRIGQAGGK